MQWPSNGCYRFKIPNQIGNDDLSCKRYNLNGRLSRAGGNLNAMAK